MSWFTAGYIYPRLHLHNKSHPAYCRYVVLIRDIGKYISIIRHRIWLSLWECGRSWRHWLLFYLPFSWPTDHEIRCWNRHIALNMRNSSILTLLWLVSFSFIVQGGYFCTHKDLYGLQIVLEIKWVFPRKKAMCIISMDVFYVDLHVTIL